MGQPIPQQHPAVVLRSQYEHIKALLAVAMLTIAALAVTVVLVTTDSDGPSAAQVTSVSRHSDARGSQVHGKASPIIRRAAAERSSAQHDGAPTERTVGIGH